ncbi:hypothetical protein NDU88_001960 [Pleurodeles waltl]|uniref:Uncharacterized protein n=1 Tax=Pleurodeles waltl TaxID=8319 RepID=A0AAV7ML99_PLEWA|nr:hypothetical protein NDU88_001960 [Pleurodeles waltl]
MGADPGDARVVFLQPGRVASLAVPGCTSLGVHLAGFFRFVDPLGCVSVPLILLPAACRLFVLGRAPCGPASLWVWPPVRPDRPDVVYGCVRKEVRAAVCFLAARGR